MFSCLIKLEQSSYTVTDRCPYLDVIVRIPVRVVDKHSVSGGQVDTQASRPSGEQEAESLGTRR